MKFVAGGRKTWGKARHRKAASRVCAVTAACQYGSKFGRVMYYETSDGRKHKVHNKKWILVKMDEGGVQD